MSDQEQIIQTTFLVPIREDKKVGNGELHPEWRWEDIIEELYKKFGGWTMAPNLYPGGWVNPKSGNRIDDESRKYFVDIKRKDLNKMRAFIEDTAGMFKQICVRFEYEGKVEYIYQRMEA